MGFVGDTVESIRSMQIRHVLTQIISLGMIVTSALIIWKGLIVVTGSESPVVVVLSGSMEPGFKRGDILFFAHEQRSYPHRRNSCFQCRWT
uniref:Signal peptidase complex catalytic subunit SEC11 n=1 Tax=Arundo donax TaxID=35708 RepID=A0A0A9CSN0_ARUDO